MSDLGVITSKDVFIAGCTGVQQMGIVESRPSNTFSHSGVAGGTQTLTGISEYTWTATGVGADCGLFPLATGASKQFTMSNETGAKLSFTGTIFVGSISYTFDTNNRQNPLSWTASGAFSGSRSQAATGTADAGGYGALSGQYLDVVWGGQNLVNGTYSTCLQSVNLTFTRQLAPYNCAGVHYILAGNLAANVTINLLDSDVSGINLSSSLHTLSVEIDGSDNSWDLNYIKVTGVNGPGGDRNNIAPMAVSISGAWSGEGGGVRGPDNTVYYGSFS